MSAHCVLKLELNEGGRKGERDGRKVRQTGGFRVIKE